jgi:hypothetical protein
MGTLLAAQTLSLEEEGLARDIQLVGRGLQVRAGRQSIIEHRAFDVPRSAASGWSARTSI